MAAAVTPAGAVPPAGNKPPVATGLAKAGAKPGKGKGRSSANATASASKGASASATASAATGASAGAITAASMAAAGGGGGSGGGSASAPTQLARPPPAPSSSARAGGSPAALLVLGGSGLLFASLLGLVALRKLSPRRHAALLLRLDRLAERLPPRARALAHKLTGGGAGDAPSSGAGAAPGVYGNLRGEEVWPWEQDGAKQNGTYGSDVGSADGVVAPPGHDDPFDGYNNASPTANGAAAH